MANQVSAHQVGSYFVHQYYHLFRQQRDCVHQFYNDSSSMIIVDGEIIQSATDLVKIHKLLMSLNLTAIEIKTINSLDSWNGGVLVVVSGAVQSLDFIGCRRFVQTFFLAPQEKGYVVLNDMFHFTDHQLDHHFSAPVAEDVPVKEPDYVSEEEASEYDNLDRGNKPAQEYSYEDHSQQDTEQDPDPDLEFEPVANRIENENHFDDHNSLHQSVAPHFATSQHAVEEASGEPEKLTYASILRAKGKPQSSSSSYQPTFSSQSRSFSDWNTDPEPLPQQSITSFPSYGVNVVEEALPSQEGESLSVYVRNLPSTITTFDILQEFENFGKIKHDGVFLRNRMDTGVCYAFVEFESIRSVHNAIQASPIQLAGRKVYIEERRPNTVSSRGGRTDVRGRGRRGGRTSGRGF